MSKLVIEGGRRLIGEVEIQGAKNSVLPILTATIMCKGESVIHNCPNLSDVDVTIEILEYLGCKITRCGSTITVNPDGVNKSDIPDTLMRKMRSSIVFLGALISRNGSARMSLPGGCELGPRPIDLHIDAMKQMGLRVDEGHGFMDCSTVSRLVGSNVALSFPSVGATENILFSAVLANGTTVITNAAREPEVCDLANYLNKCGAKISGIGESTLVVEGVSELHGSEHEVIPDRIVAVTYMAAAAVTSGELIIKNVLTDTMGALIPIFEEAGCMITDLGDNIIKLQASERPYSNKLIRTMPYPGFPTDAQAPVMSMAAVACGTSVFVENIFESRYKHVGELLRLGADIKVEGKVAIVDGVRKLSGADVTATDLRGAASLVVAGLGAEGRTNISGLSHLDRGYENIEENFKNLGAVIKRV